MQLVKTTEGKIINVVESRDVTREELAARVDELLTHVKEAEQNLIEFDRLTKPEEPTPEAMTEPEPTPTPEVEAAPAPVEPVASPVTPVPVITPTPAPAADDTAPVIQ